MFHKFGYPIGTTYFLQRKKNCPTKQVSCFLKSKNKTTKFKNKNRKWKMARPLY